MLYSLWSWSGPETGSRESPIHVFVFPNVPILVPHVLSTVNNRQPLAAGRNVIPSFLNTLPSQGKHTLLTDTTKLAIANSSGVTTYQVPLASCRRAKVQEARGCVPRGTISRSLLSLDSAFERRYLHQFWELCSRDSHSIAPWRFLESVEQTRDGPVEGCNRTWKERNNMVRFTSKLPFGSHSITTAEGSTLLNNSKDEKRH